MVESMTEQEFNQTLKTAGKPMLVDFWAPWCVPCRMTGPVVEEFAKKHLDKVDVYKVNIDENQSMADEYGIRGIPTMMAFDKGEAVKTVVGYHPLPQLEKELSALLE